MVFRSSVMYCMESNIIVNVVYGLDVSFLRFWLAYMLFFTNLTAFLNCVFLVMLLTFITLFLPDVLLLYSSSIIGFVCGFRLIYTCISFAQTTLT